MEASLWTKISKLTLNLKLKFTKRALTTLLLRRLLRRNTATNDVANFIKKIPRKFHQNQMKVRMMRTKLEDAIYQERKMRNLFTSRYDYLMRRWGHNYYFRRQFNMIMQEETRFVWTTGRERIQKKADNLAKKAHTAPARAQGIVEDHGIAAAASVAPVVITSDAGLEAQFGPVQREAPVVYGEVDITEPEAALAGLGPKFCVTPRLSMEDVQVATEELLAKMRWEDRSRDERRGEKWTPEWQIQKTLSHTVFDEEAGSMDFTDLKSNYAA